MVCLKNDSRKVTTDLSISIIYSTLQKHLIRFRYNHLEFLILIYCQSNSQTDLVLQYAYRWYIHLLIQILQNFLSWNFIQDTLRYNLKNHKRQIFHVFAFFFFSLLKHDILFYLFFSFKLYFGSENAIEMTLHSLENISEHNRTFGAFKQTIYKYVIVLILSIVNTE